MTKDWDKCVCANAYGAIILAAGLSSRMKEFKPLLPIGEKTAIDRLINVALDAGIDDIVVVTGHNRDMLTPYIEAAKLRANTVSARVEEAFNEDYMDGMFSSIKAGIRRLSEISRHHEAGKEDACRREWVLHETGDKDACRREWAFHETGDKELKMKGFFIIPVDCPLISEATIRKLMYAIESAEFSGPTDAKKLVEKNRVPLPYFYVPTFEGKKGHPLYVPMEYAEEICGYEGSGGLKAITDKYWDMMERIQLGEEGCILDMDTKEGYEEILYFMSAGCTRKPLVEYAENRKIFLVRHGQTRQHREKMFIGRYDVPLDEKCKSEVELMARELTSEIFSGGKGRFARSEDGITMMANASMSKKCIYTSPLKRAVQTAEIIKSVMESSILGLSVDIIEVEDLQEISLGSWDGKPIREIKENFPDEYERRGKDLFAFKIGNKSENYYDVQYRAVRALRRILAENRDEEIIVVSHNAVIRALANNLGGLRVDDEWKSLKKGAYLTIENL